jgi:hypothetical protein
MTMSTVGLSSTTMASANINFMLNWVSPEERAITMGASQKKFSMWLSLLKGFRNEIYSRKMPLMSPKVQEVPTRQTQTCRLMI